MLPLLFQTQIQSHIHQMECFCRWC